MTKTFGIEVEEPQDALNAMLDRIVEIDERKAELAAEGKSLSGERDALQDNVLTAWVENETTKITRRGVTIYIHGRLWARPKEGRDAGAKALVECDLSFLIKHDFNLSQVTAYAKETLDAGGELPDKFTEAFDVGKAWNIRTRKS